MYETVSAIEKRTERELLTLVDNPVSRGAGMTESKVSRHSVKNFTCTECGETLNVAVAYNLVVRGRCVKTGGLVNVNVSRGYKLI